jgi:ferredoxin
MSENPYRALQRHLDRMPVAFPPTESGVEIRILQRLFTPEEAELALALSAIPEPASTIAPRLRPRPALADLEGKLDRMGDKGILLAIPAEGGKRYSKLQFAIGMYERQLKTLTPELDRDSRQYMEEAYHRAFHTGKTTQLRIVPVNREVALDRHVAPYDRIREYVAASPGPFGVLTCICRHGRDLAGQPCRQTELRDNCLMIGMAAQWAADSGMGRAITREEMLALLNRADRDGLVLEPENTQAPMFICCCCGCCCGVLESAKRLPEPARYFTSNFYAVAEGAECESCGVCETRCQMDAISLAGGTAVVDRARCIGCALCVSTCISGAMRLEPVDQPKVPPEDTKALYLKLFQDRFGPWGMMKIGLRYKLGLRI